MSQVPDPSIEPTATAPPPVYATAPNRLYQAAAWVVIVAGIVFIVSVIFFSGAAVARHQRCHHYWPGMYGPGGGAAGPPGLPGLPGPPPGPPGAPPGGPLPAPPAGPGGPAQPPPPAPPPPAAPPRR